ncbi:hypothetical protein [Gangjinia marincola]|uniref:hypothetical protein n=1 Tax=Gangjinia marincola TaxID=578463 RepID=UPI0031D45B48
MQFTRTHLLSAGGVLFFAFFMGLSFYNNALFFDQILICTVILGLIFFIKGKNQSNESRSTSTAEMNQKVSLERTDHGLNSSRNSNL